MIIFAASLPKSGEREDIVLPAGVRQGFEKEDKRQSVASNVNTMQDKYAVVKKKIYTICGSYRPAFSKFVTTVENLPEKRDLLLECACMLSDPDVLEKKNWKDFSVLFLRHYEKEILVYLGFEKSVSEFPPIKVGKRKLFLEYFSQMMHNGVFENCTSQKISEFIHVAFATDYSVATIRTRLSDLPEKTDG